MPLKKYYTDLAGILISLSTFAGGLIIATQFIISCPHSRLEALLALASQLFLGTPLCLLSIYLITYGLKDEFEIQYSRPEHAYMCAQFCMSGILLGTAFILLAIAIFVAEVDGKEIGIWGLVMLSIFLSIGIIAGVLKSGVWKWLPWVQNYLDEEDKRLRVNWSSFWRFMLLFPIQFIFFCLLLGYGGHAASQAPIKNGCTNSKTSTSGN